MQERADFIMDYAIEGSKKNLNRPLIFMDAGTSNSTNRKEFNELLTMVLERKVDRIFVDYLENLTCCLNVFARVCKHMGTTIIPTSQALDMDVERESIYKSVFEITEDDDIDESDLPF